MEKHTAHKKIGLALGGGAVKGLAHIGIIKTLENAGIGIDFIAGTSMGALIGGYYAATKDINAIENIALQTKKTDLFSAKDFFKKRDGAFFKGESIADWLKKELGDIKIEDCKIPFAAVATDAKNGDEFHFHEGSLVDAIRASIAIPLIFSPIEIGEKLFVDGGLSNPVPADVVKKMGAERVIAVDVSSRWLEAPEEMATMKDMYSVIAQSLSVIEYQLAKNILKKSADIILRPPVFNYHWFQFEHSSEIIKIGKEEALLRLKEIRQKTGYKKPKETMGEKFFSFILNEPY
ncbi:patatin-like phospholipase family protein [Candidatus Wolfebacteria bacterium]|nr:patatin-like phospholipase family protein [Candidatus Wolfebacteria bacterium]